MTGLVLSLEGVVAGYGGHPVLRGLDLTIAAGQVHALLGPNGSGKSTAARVACGLLRPSGGRVQRQGVSVGLAPQEIALFPRLTVKENLRVLSAAAGIRGSRANERVEQALALTACTERADARVETLSGGWRRRANLAGALVSEAALLVVDEPTEGVDAATRGVLADALKHAARDGRGCLLISHDAEFVERTADRVGFLREGRMIREGEPARLLRETFGERRIVTVTTPSPVGSDLAKILAEDGFVADAQGLSWRRSAEDPLEVVRRLSPAVDATGGELAISRPGLDDLAANGEVT